MYACTYTQTLGEVVSDITSKGVREDFTDERILDDEDQHPGREERAKPRRRKKRPSSLTEMRCS